MVDKDADGLRSLMSADYYLMHMTGVKHNILKKGDLTQWKA